MQSAGTFITGAGLVTALGDSVDETWRRLLAGEFIRTHARAAIEPDGRRSWVTQLALHAAREAIENARWGADLLADPRTALLIGTSRGPINEWIAAKAHESLIGIHAVAADVSRELRMGQGPRLTYSAACASSLHALIRACMMLKSGEADRALVIGAEASLHPLFLQCFQRMGVLPREGIGCRPFDVNREGFLVSEGAAAVCLESRDSARTLLAVDRFMLGSDASTITSADPSGAVIREMLKHVIGGQKIDLIQAHATGTVANDPVELSAIEQSISVDATPPVLYSHKGALGHSLGASGLISVVLSCQMHARGIVPSNVRTLTPMAVKRVRLASTAIASPIQRSICIAAGFGGPVAVVGLESTR